MPLRQCESGGRYGWQWNDETCYTGKNARKKALRQGIAEELDRKRTSGEFRYKEFVGIEIEEINEALAELDPSKTEYVFVLGTLLAEKNKIADESDAETNR